MSLRFRQTVGLALLTGCVLSGWCGTSWAQVPQIGGATPGAASLNRASNPSYLLSPSLSPYFQLFQNNTGALPNYHAFVRPRLEARAQFQRQAQEINQLGRQVAVEQNQINLGLNQQRIMAEEAAVPVSRVRQRQLRGVTITPPATYMNLAPYYYSGPQGVGRGSR